MNRREKVDSRIKEGIFYDPYEEENLDEMSPKDFEEVSNINKITSMMRIMIIFLTTLTTPIQIIQEIKRVLTKKAKNGK